MTGAVQGLALASDKIPLTSPSQQCIQAYLNLEQKPFSQVAMTALGCNQAVTGPFTRETQNVLGLIHMLHWSHALPAQNEAFISK